MYAADHPGCLEMGKPGSLILYQLHNHTEKSGLLVREKK